MMIPVLLLTLRFASAHGSDRSHHLMVEFGRAVRGPDLVVAGAQYRPLDDDGLVQAIDDLDRGIRAANEALADCADDLFPARVREWPAPERANYAALYRSHVAGFRDALVAYRDECARQARLGAGDRTTAELLRAKARYVDLARRAHREL